MINTTISVPIWIFVILVLFSAWSILSRMLIPSVRWYFRRRINRVINEIASHLDLELRPFQLTKRQVLIDRLTFDPKVMEAIQDISSEKEIPLDVLQAEVNGYAREIVPSFNAYLYFRLGYWLARKIARLIYKVRVDRIDNEKLALVERDSTVVFVMNHRSNMDYILVAFLAMERTSLSYAVGEWARIWPLESLIKAMGAFFVRRKSGNSLYRLVLERYINMATREGVCQAVFLEGGLSKDGLLRDPKFGLIDYMLRYYDDSLDRDVVFIPVGLNYDRTIEDRSLLRGLNPEAQKRSLMFVLKTTLGFIIRNFFQMAVGKWRRFGYACVNFGDPISMKAYSRDHQLKFKELQKEERFEKVETLCNYLMTSIEAVVPVLPVPLVSAVMIGFNEEGKTLAEVKDGVDRLVGELKANGAPIYYPKKNFEKYIATALEMLIIRHMLVENEGRYAINPEMIDILTYYANSMDHWKKSGR